MNKSKKRMKNKKGRNGNRSVKMRGGYRGKRIKTAVGISARNAIEVASSAVRNAPTSISAAVGKAYTGTSAAVRNAPTVISAAVGKAYTGTSSAVRNAPTSISAAVGKAYTGTSAAARNAYTGTSAAATAASNAVGKAFTTTSYEKQFDKKVLKHISGKKNIIESIEDTEFKIIDFYSKIKKAYKQLDIFEYAYSRSETIEPKLKAYLNIFSDSYDKLDKTYKNFINKIEELLKTAITKADKEQKTIQDKGKELENAVIDAENAVIDAEKAVIGAQNAVIDAQNVHLYTTGERASYVGHANKTLTSAQTVLTAAQTESAETAANEFLNNVSFNEATTLYNIIKNFLEEYKKDKNTLNSILFDNYKQDMYELIAEKKKMYNQIFKFKKNYTKQEYETFFTNIINKIDFAQYDNLVELYNVIVNELKKIYFSDDSKRLLEFANKINKYDLSSFEDLVPAEARPITREPTEDKNNKNKITDININFYKSNFENTNPFPYYEQVVLNRTGQDVISDLYGVEELFPTFKDELDFLSDPSKKDKFKSFENKNIKIKHTKNYKSAPTFYFE